MSLLVVVVDGIDATQGRWMQNFERMQEEEVFDMYMRAVQSRGWAVAGLESRKDLAFLLLQ